MPKLVGFKTRINNNYTVEGELQRVVTGNIARLKDINAYRWLAPRGRIAVTGQRTRTNARDKSRQVK